MVRLERADTLRGMIRRELSENHETAGLILRLTVAVTTSSDLAREFLALRIAHRGETVRAGVAALVVDEILAMRTGGR